MNNLSAPKISALKRTPGYHSDGDGLYLQVQPGTGKNAGKFTHSWIYRYSVTTYHPDPDGGEDTKKVRAREMGLGSLKNWKLAEARERA